MGPHHHNQPPPSVGPPPSQSPGVGSLHHLSQLPPRGGWNIFVIRGRGVSPHRWDANLAASCARIEESPSQLRATRSGFCQVHPRGESLTPPTPSAHAMRGVPLKRRAGSSPCEPLPPLGTAPPPPLQRPAGLGRLRPPPHTNIQRGPHLLLPVHHLLSIASG